MAAPGMNAWSVFGEIGLDGMGRTLGQLATFDAAGKKASRTVLGLEGRTAALATAAGASALAASAVGVASVKAFASFDKAMTESLAIMGDVSDEMRGEMSDAAREVGRTTQFSARQAAESFFFLASAGLDAEQSIAALPQVAAFAQAGQFDMARATDLLTDAQSALGLTVDDTAQNMENMARVSDVLVKANTLANASVEQFSTALTSKAGSALKAFNIDLEEGVAVLAAFADQGVKAELAGNALDRILRLMPDAALKNADAYEELGIEVFDASGNLNNLADIVEDLETALGDMTDQQKQATLDALGFRARVQGIIKPLLGTSEAIREYESGLREAGGITRDVADKQIQNLIDQLDILKDEIVDIGLAIGGDLTPDIQAFVKAVREIIQGFRNWKRESEEVARGFGPIPGMLEEALNHAGPAGGVFRTLADGLREAGREADTTDTEFSELEETMLRLLTDERFKDLGLDFEVVPGEDEGPSEPTTPEGPDMEAVRKDAQARFDELQFERSVGLIDLETFRDEVQSMVGLFEAGSEERIRLERTVTEATVMMLEERVDQTNREQEARRQALEEGRALEQAWIQFRLDAGQMTLEERLRQINAELAAEEEGSRRKLELERERMDVVQRLAQERIRAIQQSFADDPEALAAGLSQLEEELRARFADLPNVADEAGDEAESAASDVGGSFTDALGSIKADAARMGSQAVLSFAFGAKDQQPTVEEIFKGIAQIAIDALFNKFLFGSPSKVMMGMGQDVVRGFEIGMEQRADALRDTVARVFQPPTLDGRMRFEDMTRSLDPVRMGPDLSKLPPARTPFDVIRDADWQRIYRETGEVAQAGGWRP